VHFALQLFTMSSRELSLFFFSDGEPPTKSELADCDAEWHMHMPAGSPGASTAARLAIRNKGAAALGAKSGARTSSGGKADAGNALGGKADAGKFGFGGNAGVGADLGGNAGGAGGALKVKARSGKGARKIAQGPRGRASGDNTAKGATAGGSVGSAVGLRRYRRRGGVNATSLRAHGVGGGGGGKRHAHAVGVEHGAEGARARAG